MYYSYLSVVLILLCHALLHNIDLDAYLIIHKNYESLFLYSEDHNFLDRTFSSETFVLCYNPVITTSYWPDNSFLLPIRRFPFGGTGFPTLHGRSTRKETQLNRHQLLSKGASNESSNVLLGDMCPWQHARLHSGSQDAKTCLGEPQRDLRS